MELPRRPRGDELLGPGELTRLRARLRAASRRSDLTTVVASAFDWRTRMLPYSHVDRRMAPAGARAIGSAMVDAGFHRTRIVLQQWSRNFRPSRMQLDGKTPDVFMVSSLQIYTAGCKALIRDACRIPAARRPLIIAGGPKAVYEPWDLFSTDPADPWGADVVVTGEEYVLLSLLEALLAARGNRESMRDACIRVRDAGMLDAIPGLVYPRTNSDGLAQELVDTGIQRLVGDLDELPHPALGFGLLERPSRRATLASQPLPARRVAWHTPIGSLVMTFGCRFGCPYCPIPAYNQKQHRSKSPERIVDEMRRLRSEYNIRFFFGADDNFFNDKDRSLAIIEAMARTKIDGEKFHRRISWGTETTVHDTLRMKEHVRLMRHAGVWALWMGVEDMTATLVKKGQTVDNTLEVFRMLRREKILPMPMMMHHDCQPLYTRGTSYGLLNQVSLLRKAGAVTLQVLMMSPAVGSKHYDEVFTSGMVYHSAGKRVVEPRMFDGNYVVASADPKPWRRQASIILAYMYFYNPARALMSLLRPRSRCLIDFGAQIVGMWGLIKTIRRTAGWALRLMLAKCKRQTELPVSPIPMRDPHHRPAAHALPGTPLPAGCEEAHGPAQDHAEDREPAAVMSK